MPNNSTDIPKVISYVIYNSPVGFAGFFVAVKFLILPNKPVPVEVVAIAKTLQKVRDLLPRGLCLFNRDETDAPNIVETWT